MAHARLVRGALLTLAWLVVSFAIAAGLFLSSSRTVVLASHDAVIRPTLSGHVVLRTGPILPDIRLSSGSVLGVDAVLGKTNVKTTSELVKRYAYIASQPEGQITKVRDSLVDMAVAAALRGGALGLVPVFGWWLIGPARRRDLLSRIHTRRGMVGVLVALLIVALVWQPWRGRETTVSQARTWIPLAEYLGPEVPLPDEVPDLEVRADSTTQGSRRLIESAISTYDKSRAFYDAAAEKAAALELRQPEDGENVVVMLSDRHDNIGMDAVARAIGDAGGATAVFDAGDDTSSGQSWEAFSLDSVSTAFEGYERYGASGNHDNGDFVANYLGDHGWTMLDGEVVDGPEGIQLLGLADPRSSGLGNWRDEVGLSFEEVGSRLSQVACDADQRVGTILVHDANLAREALAAGCADLVIGGHLHVEVGPTPVLGSNGTVGYSYTMGTTGGAAYALAVGSKPRREAMISLLTYRDGRPVGIQSVRLQTNGAFQVGAYTELDLAPLDAAQPAEPASTPAG